MAFYVAEKVGNTIVKKKYAPVVPMYRGFWAIVIGGFAGTLVSCNGTSVRYIGSNEKTVYQIIEPGTYTFTATRHGETVTKTITLDDSDPNNTYTVYLGLYIGMQYIDYIESSGTQWIDTGYIPNNNTRVKVKVQFKNVENYHTAVFGASNWVAGNGYRFFLWDSQVQCDYDQSNILGTTVAVNDIIELDYNKDTVSYSKNGTTQTPLTFTFSEFTAPFAMTLFGCRTEEGAPPPNFGEIRMYYCQIYDNDVLVHDFVPVADDTNSGALYDKVTQQIYYNSGTGEFACGPKKPYTRIAYLESTGTQWIDTGFVPNQNSGMTLVINTDMSNKPLPAYCSEVIESVNNAFGVSQNSSRATTAFLVYNGRSDNDGYWRVEKTDIYGGGTGKYTININKRNVSISPDGGTTVSSTLTDSTYQMTNTVKLWPEHAICKIYSCKLYDNGTLVRDLVPVLDNEGIPCMYDRQNDRLYYNDGTGQFIAGPEYIELEYVEATGTQYVYTGISPTADTEVKVKAKFTRVGVGNWDNIVGSKGDPNDSNKRFYPFGTDKSVSKFRFTYGISEVLVNWDTNIHTVDFNNANHEVYVDNVLAGTLSSSGFNPAGAIEMALFAYNLPTAPDPASMAEARIYEYEVYQGGVLVQKLIPTKNSDNRVGFYDEVSDTFLISASGTELIAGPEKQ